MTRQQIMGRALFKKRLARLVRMDQLLEAREAQPTYILAAMLDQLQRALRLWDPVSVATVEAGSRLAEVRRAAGFCAAAENCDAPAPLREWGDYLCDGHEAEFARDDEKGGSGDGAE